MTFSSSSSTPFHLFTDQNDISETQFLKNSIVNHTKYGSTNHNSGPSQNYRYITHYVDASDTLQGLSLKYGRKIETLKKFNKLYSDDNNYLRSRLSLLIPIEISIENNSNSLDSNLSPAQTPSSSSSLDTQPHSSTYTNHTGNKVVAHHSLSFDQNNRQPNLKKPSKSPNKSISLCDASHLDNSNTVSQESVADFLIRIDSSIAKTKSQVDKMSKKIDDHSLEQELSKGTSKRFNTPKLASSERSAGLTSSSSSRSLFPFDADGNLPRVSMSNNRRKIKSSLKRFEKSHEEIFEL